MTKDAQLAELKRIEKEFFSVLNDAEGFFFTDNGYRPNQLVQARNRFTEAVLWAELWINVNL